MKLTDVARASLAELANDYLNWLLQHEEVPWSVNSDIYRKVANTHLDKPAYKDDVQHLSSLHILAQKHKFDEWPREESPQEENSLYQPNDMPYCSAFVIIISKTTRIFQLDFLIRQPFIPRQQVDDPTVGEAVLGEVVLHNDVVAVGVDADVGVAGEGEVHHAAEDAVRAVQAAHTVDHVVRPGVVEPLATENLLVGGLRRRQEREIAHNLPVVFNHEAAITPDVILDGLHRRVAVNPLLPVARCLHFLARIVEDRHNARNVRLGRGTDCPRNCCFCLLDKTVLIKSPLLRIIVRDVVQGILAVS